MNFKRKAIAMAFVTSAALFPGPVQASPQAIIAAAVSTAVSAGVAWATSAAAWAAFSVVGTFATTFALSAISGLLASKPDQPSFQQEARGRTVVVRSAVATRKMVYGQCVVSGPLVYAESTTRGADLYHHYVIPLATHECEEIGDVYFGDEVVGTLDGSGNVTSGTFNGYARIKKHLGASDQTADSDLVAESAGLWTTAHRLRGITYIYVRLLINSGVFPNGIPNFKAVVKGKKLYDPRVAGSPTVTAWSDNWALVCRDYLASAYGLGCSDAEIDDVALTAAANTSDELVVTGAGSPAPTQKCYTANGTVDLGNKPRDIMQSLLTAGAGSCVYAQGVYRVLAGVYSAATISVDEDWLAGGIKVRPRVARQDLYNAVRGTYSDPDKQWQPTDFSPVTNSTYETQDGGLQIARDIELPFTTDPMAAQRIAKIHLEKGRQSIAVQMTCNLKAFKLRVWDTVLLTLDLMGWTDKVFLVTGWALSERGTIDITLQEEASTSYDWDYTEATVLATPPDVSIASGSPAFAWTTFDPSGRIGDGILSNGNLKFTSTDVANTPSNVALTFQAIGGSPSSLRYAEFDISSAAGAIIGIAKSTFVGSGSQYVGYDTAHSVGVTFASGTIVGMLFDAATGTLSYTLDGAPYGSPDAAYTGLTGSYTPAVTLANANNFLTANFGASAWTHTPPAGYVGWST